MIDPFENVEPLEPLDPFQVLTAQLSRSMLWDMIGPDNIKNSSELFNQQPASDEVLEAEAADMWARKQTLIPFGMDFPLLCYMAAESASLVMMKGDEKLGNLSTADKMQFRAGNVKLGTAIAEAVVSHMLQKGLIKHGERQ